MIEEVDADESGEIAFVPDSLLLEQSLNGVNVELALDDLEIEDVFTSLDFLVSGREVAIGVARLTRCESLIRWADTDAS